MSTITGLSANTTYMFEVTATNEVGNESEGLSVEATTLARSSEDSDSDDRVRSGNADLRSLQVLGNDQQLTLDPVFAPATTTYSVETKAEQVEIIKTYIVAIKRLTLENEKNEENEEVEFSDIAGHWAESFLLKAVSMNLISGYPDGTFKPDDSISRVEFTAILARALQLEAKGSELFFTDKEQIGSWAEKSITKMVQAGFISGYEDGSFRPYRSITRIEMVAMLSRTLQTPIVIINKTSFADDEAIDAWAKSSVEAMKQAGIIVGRGGNRFMPNEIATRAEAVVMILRMLDKQ